jgi:AcrR family transcriptional regulator
MARSAGITRAQVVEAAAALADQHGLESLTLAQVAAQLGVRLPSLYNHVDGLAGMRRELALVGARELAAALTGAAVGRAGDAAVRAIAGAYREYARAHPGRYEATLRAPAPDETELQAQASQIIDLLLVVLEPYRLDGPAAIHAIRALRSLVHGFVTLENAGGFGLPLDLNESFHRLVGMYIAGLHAAGAALRP